MQTGPGREGSGQESARAACRRALLASAEREFTGGAQGSLRCVVGDDTVPSKPSRTRRRPEGGAT
jgi:hypothetical protein